MKFHLGWPFVDPELFHAAYEIHREIVPSCSIRPTHGDSVQLVVVLVSGEIDAAIMTLPISDPRLSIKEVRRDRLVVCLRADHPLASKAALRPDDLHGNLSVLHHPQRHPEGHARLLEMLGNSGVQIGGFSRALHPIEMHELVKGGYGFALIREGTALDTELTARPIAGMDWTVDTAFVYQKQLHPKTIPVLLRHLKKRLAALPHNGHTPQTARALNAKNGKAKRPPGSEEGGRNGSPCWLPQMKFA